VSYFISYFESLKLNNASIEINDNPWWSKWKSFLSKLETIYCVYVRAIYVLSCTKVILAFLFSNIFYSIPLIKWFNGHSIVTILFNCRHITYRHITYSYSCKQTTYFLYSIMHEYLHIHENFFLHEYSVLSLVLITRQHTN